MPAQSALEAAVAALTGLAGLPIITAHREPLCEATNITTAGLERHWGTLADGTAWQLVAKTLRPADDSPVWEAIPEPWRELVLRELDWMAEPRIFQSGVGEQFPEGVRLPHLAHIERMERRLTLWMEAIDSPGHWDLSRYERTARSLGRLSSHLSLEEISGHGIGTRPLDGLFYGRICQRDLPMLSSDSFWSTPLLGEVEAELRPGLAALGEWGPDLLAELLPMPKGLVHGDAAPGNLLEAPDGSLVLIDCSYMNIGELGSDLAQLLAARCLAGHSDAPLSDLMDVITEGFVEGARSGIATPVDPDQVRRACAIHLAFRSLFDGLIVDRPAGPVAAREMERRIELRFGLDLVGSTINSS